MCRRILHLTYNLALISVFLISAASCVMAQGSPAASTPSPGVVRGLTLAGRLEGSINSDGQVTDLNTSIGYNFNRHFGLDVGIPFYFNHTASTISQTSPSTASGKGIGDFYADIRSSWEGRILNLDSSLTGTAPTGSQGKGLSTGHFTYSWDNEISHDFDRISPFVDVGLANSVSTRGIFRRPFISLGHVANFEGGFRFELLKQLSWSISAYDVAPWGTQTVYSRVVRQSGPSTPGSGKGQHGYRMQSVTQGTADLTRDNGINTSVTFQPTRLLDFMVGYTRSVRLQLNTVSFGIGFRFGGVSSRKK